MYIPVVYLLAPFIGGMLTAAVSRNKKSSMWYEKLKQSPATPPKWAFGVAWTTLYILLGVSGYLLASSCDKPCTIMAVFLTQLILNFMWMPVFFGCRAPRAGLVVVIATLISTCVAIYYAFRVSPAAAYFMLPYACWLLFACYLNAYIVIQNPSENA